jgi:hypothetical protein
MDIINFKVSADNEHLELWVEIPDGPNYVNVNLDKVAIIDYRGFVSDSSYPTTHNKIEFSTSGIDFFKITDSKKLLKRIELNNPAHSILLGSKHSMMYYVYIQMSGFPLDDGCFKDLVVGCTINHYPIYNLLLSLICSDDRCNSNIDKVLDIYVKKNLIEQAIELFDYDIANKLFDDIYKREILKGYCLDGCNTYIGGKSINISGCKC